ncbi:MAG: siphovirus Gp157 family protein [Oscillospiraceae bacterium]|jgi:hypothetical protein|nr:siphovirus Gp157 family protein [Oscillospiraceae bacterium]
MNLYDLTAEIEELEALYENEEIPEDVFRDTLEGLQGEFENKAESIACWIKNLLSEAEAIKAEEERLYNRRKVKENQADRIKKYLLEAMEFRGVKKIDRPKAKIVFNLRSGSSIKIDEFAEIPEQFYKPPRPPEPDKAALKDALKEGVKIKGVELTNSKYITIK